MSGALHLLGLDCFGFAVDADFDFVRLWGRDAVIGDLPVLPFDIDRAVATGAQAFDVPARPGFRQRGQQVDHAGVRLQQHLGDAGGCPMADFCTELPRAGFDRGKGEAIIEGIPRVIKVLKRRLAFVFATPSPLIEVAHDAAS